METGLSASEKEELYFVVLSSSDLSDNRFCRWPTQIELTGPAYVELQDQWNGPYFFS